MSAIASPEAASLAELQGVFQEFLLARSDAFQSEVCDSLKAARTTLLDVYLEGYALRLIEALTTDYPGLIAMVGSASFDDMARAHIVAYPSRHPSVRRFGRSLTDFLESTAPYDCLPAVAEMARFEWKLGEAWDAPDIDPVPAAPLIALPPEAWETLAFTVLPSLRWVMLAFDVPQARQRREEVVAGSLEVVTATAPVPWVIWRSDLLTRYRSLEADEALLLDALVVDRTFPELCDSLAGFTGEADAAAPGAGLLRAWAEAGIIGSFQY
jgi:putative DNA-binding protein